MAEKFPSWKQALITFVGGIVLAFSTCFGFAVTLEENTVVPQVMVVGFIASLVVIVLGFIFIILRIVRAMMDKGTPTNTDNLPKGPFV